MSLYERFGKEANYDVHCALSQWLSGYLFPLQRLPIDPIPILRPIRYRVMTAYPGASAADIENNLTRPRWENALNAVSEFESTLLRSLKEKYIVDYP